MKKTRNIQLDRNRKRRRRRIAKENKKESLRNCEVTRGDDVSKTVKKVVRRSRGRLIAAAVAVILWVASGVAGTPFSTSDGIDKSLYDIVRNMKEAKASFMVAEASTSEIEQESLPPRNEEAVEDKANLVKERVLRNTDKFLLYGFDEEILEEEEVAEPTMSSAISFASRDFIVTPAAEPEVEEDRPVVKEETSSKKEVTFRLEVENQDLEEWRIAVVEEALKHVGDLDYVWGAEDLEDGADCSGFVFAVFSECGYEKYYGSRCTAQRLLERAEEGKYELIEPYEGALPGDIIVYKNSDSYIESNPDEREYGHCGIYVGNGKIVHMNGKSKGCDISDVQFRVNRSEYVMVRLKFEEPAVEESDCTLAPDVDFDEYRPTRAGLIQS